MNTNKPITKLQALNVLIDELKPAFENKQQDVFNERVTVLESFINKIVYKDFKDKAKLYFEHTESELKREYLRRVYNAVHSELIQNLIFDKNNQLNLK